MTEITETELRWRQTRQHVQELFKQLSEDDKGNVVIPAEVSDAFAKLGEKDWDNNRRVYTFGTGDAAKTILAARAGLIPWWTAMTGAAFFGNVDALRKIKTAIDTHETNPDRKPGFNSTLTWISHPYTLIGHTRNKIEAPVLKQLMEWGADPNYEDGKWLVKAMQYLNADAVKIFIDHGANYDTIMATLHDAGSKSDLYKRVLPLLPGRTFTAKNGEETLVQTQVMGDLNGVSLFRTIFNFRAQRVHEIYEAANTTPVMKSYDFAEYNTSMLGDARDALKSLGGSVPDMLRATGKPLAVPQGLKRKPAEGPAS